MSGGDPKTIGRLAVEYVASRYALARDTRSRYRNILLGFTEFVGGVPAADLEREHIEAWLASRRCARSTLSHELGIVRGWCQWLALRGYCPREATLGVRLARQRRQRVPLTPKVLEQVLAAPVDPRTRLVVSLTVREALRPIEIAELRCGDVDLDRSALCVGGRHSRLLPLTSGTVEALHAYLRIRPAATDALVASAPPSRPGPITPARVGAIILDALKASGVKRGPRDLVDASALRHAAMSGWRDRGADPAAIGQAGGYRGLGEVDMQHRPWGERDLTMVVTPGSTLPAHGDGAGE